MEAKKDIFLRQEPISECVITDKVFFQCYQRECMPEAIVELPETGGPFTFVDVTFGPGIIVEGTLNITPVENTDPTLNRITFILRVPFVARVRNSGGSLVSVDSSVDLPKDDIIRIPENPFDEFSFNIVLETRSELLRSTIANDNLELVIGTMVVIKVVGRVQLTVLSLGYCAPEPCEEFIAEDACEDFMNLPFEQIFPEQLNGIPQ